MPATGLRGGLILWVLLLVLGALLVQQHLLSSDVCVPRVTLSQGHQARLRKVMNTVSQMLSRRGIPHWLSDGSLLGVIRDGRAIPWEHDGDLGILAEDAERVMSLRGEARVRGLQLIRRRRHGFKFLAVDNRRVWVDVYVQDGWKNCNFTAKDIQPLPLTTARTLDGDTFPVPARPREVLDRCFGPAWKKPPTEKVQCQRVVPSLWLVVIIVLAAFLMGIAGKDCLDSWVLPQMVSGGLLARRHTRSRRTPLFIVFTVCVTFVCGFFLFQSVLALWRVPDNGDVTRHILSNFTVHECVLTESETLQHYEQDIADAILSRDIVVQSSNHQTRSCVHVAFTLDGSGYLRGILAAINSVRLNSLRELSFHVIVPQDMAEEVSRTLRFMKRQPRTSVEVVAFDPVPFFSNKVKVWKGGRKDVYTNLFTYVRILLPFLLPLQVETVVYLDGDVIVQDDIGKIAFAVNETAFPLAAVRSGSRYCWLLDCLDEEVSKAIHTPRARYLNNGVLVMDVRRLRTVDYLRRMGFWLNRNTQKRIWRFGSQPVFNLVFHESFHPLEPRWNHKVKGSYATPKKQRDVSAAVLHWVGRSKPWEGETALKDVWCSFYPYPEDFYTNEELRACTLWIAHPFTNTTCARQEEGEDMATPRFSLVVPVGFDGLRFPRLYQTLLDLVLSMPELDAVFVHWVSNTVEPPALTCLWNRVPIHFVRHEEDSLDNRFLPLPALRTDAVFHMDDDTVPTACILRFALELWREHPERIVGFTPREIRVADDGTLHYIRKGRRCGVHLVLTHGIFLHRRYLDLYWSRNDTQAVAMRSIVHELRNGEDIGMNFLVGRETGGLPPLIIGNELKNRTPYGKRAPAISHSKDHDAERTLILNRMVQEAFGRVTMAGTCRRIMSCTCS